MRHVVLLSLADTASAVPTCANATPPARVPVLRCVDALGAAGRRAEVVTAASDAEIDSALKPVEAGEADLIVAAAADGQVRAVLRRLVRRYAPAPSKRPADLPADRTLPDLPPIGILPLAPAVPDLVTELGLPVSPEAVAAALASGRVRRWDLLRTDAGSVTVHACLLGGVDDGGRVSPWRGRVEVDDSVLTDGAEPVLACAVVNAGGSEVDGLPLVTGARPDDGRVEVAIAVPIRVRRLLRAPAVRIEVRRARGRAVSITPRDGEIPLLDDGVAGELGRKRSWWIERAAWGTYVADE